MSDYRNYSKVLSVSYGDSYGRMLKLECGHEVYRYCKVAPKKVKCERCLLTPRAADGACTHVNSAAFKMDEHGNLYCSICSPCR